MKKILSLFFILFSCLCSRAALYPISFEEKFASSPLIVEGKVVSQYSFWNEGHTMIFTASTIELSKVFNGSFAGNRLEVLTNGGVVGTQAIEASDLLKLAVGNQGVFFLQDNSNGIHAPGSGALPYDVYASSQGLLLYEKHTHSAVAPFAFYANIAKDLYPLLEARSGHPYRYVGPSGDVEFAGMQNKTAGSITSFSTANATTPSHAHAGAHFDATNNLLTINGSGFGTGSGSAAVLFKNADNGGSGTISVAYSSSLVSSWSNTQIVLKVPQNAGTGVISVLDNTGAAAGTSSSSLIIDYAVMSVDFGAGVSNGPEEVNLMNTNAAGGYTIKYSTSTAGSGVDLTSAGGAAIQAAFKRALTTHKEMLGFNVTESGTNSTTQAVTGDGTNLIVMDNTNAGMGVTPLSSGVLATCYSYFSKCGSTIYASQKTEFDVIIRNSGVSSGSTTFATGPCAPATAEIDLETVILHELGHAACLNHVIEPYSGSFLPNINPAAVMNFSVVNGVKRTSPDNAMLFGEQYTTATNSNSYGCGFTTEMTPLTATIASRDECSAVSLSSLAAIGTPITFDLVHASNNRTTDPQATAIFTSATTTAITNTVYYGFKTAASGSGTLNMNIVSYATTPAAQSACSGAGVELSLYQVSSCPTGGSFPTPVAYRTFNGTGGLTTITGLAPNTSYLVMADGLNGTKANFTLSLAGTALPLHIVSFTGAKGASANVLRWEINKDESTKELQLQRSTDGVHFTAITLFGGSRPEASAGSFDDVDYEAGANLYRLAIVSLGGEVIYSNIISLDRISEDAVWITPNPAGAEAVLHTAFSIATDILVMITDAKGATVSHERYSASAGSYVHTLDAGKLAPGIYTVIVDAGVSGKRDILRLMKQ